MSTLYTLSSETSSSIQKFRFGSSRIDKMQANVYAIEKGTYQIKQENDEPIDNIEDLVEELPDSQPRFVLVSYPYKLSDGRTKSPFVLVYWRPLTCGNESKMLFAGAVEFFRGRAGVSKLIEIQDEEDFENFQSQLD